MRNFALPIPSPAVSGQFVGRFEVLVAAQSRTLGIQQVLWNVYLLVTAVLLARFGRGLWTASRLRRQAQRIPVSWAGTADVRASHQVRTPLSFGSTILLPAAWESWEPAKLAAVIAHESAHIREHDCYRLWLMSLYGAFFWFNPCAIWLRRRLTVLAELISDEAAITVTGNRIGYAEVLVNLVAEAQLPRVTLGMALPATLIPRLKRLLETDMHTVNLRLARRLMLMSAVTLTAATAAFGARAPLVLTAAQDAAVQWVSGDMAEAYPKSLQKKGVQGQVLCRVTIDAMGQVMRVIAVKADQSHPELTVAAVKAVRTFHFNNTLDRPVIKMLSVKFELR
jgi:TonB family protein